jgi:hypothetical protein
MTDLALPDLDGAVTGGFTVLCLVAGAEAAHLMGAGPFRSRGSGI